MLRRAQRDGGLARRRLDVDLEGDPLSLLINFFDCAIVLALAFMAALVASPPGTVTSTPGAVASTPRANVPLESQIKLDRFQETREKLGGDGERLGVAYRLKTGEVVYVSDTSEGEK